MHDVWNFILFLTVIQSVIHLDSEVMSVSHSNATIWVVSGLTLDIRESYPEIWLVNDLTLARQLSESMNNTGQQKKTFCLLLRT